jgi:8-oxo-dGTP diphosphatase
MPKATVAALITTTTSGIEQILLTRRAVEPFKDYWCLPGGHFQPDERARDAIIREVKEETGLEFAPTFFAYADEIISDLNIHTVVLVFTGNGIGTLTTQPGEVTDIGWFTIEEAQRIVLAFTHNDILSAYASTQQHSADNS